MSQNGHTSVHSRGSGAGGASGLGHSVINPTGSNMNPSSSPSSVSWSHVNNGSSVSGPVGNHSVSVAHQQQQQQQDAKPAPSPQNSNQSGTTLKEHDLLGLSEVSSTSRDSPVKENSLQDEGNDFDGLNLNMELGPPAARKKADAGFSQPRTPAVSEQQQASESGNSSGSMDGAQAGAEQGTVLAVDKSSSSAEQSTTASEQGDRGFSYSAPTQGGRAEAGEALMKWHVEQQGADRKSCNETLRLAMSLHTQQRGVTQDGLTEKATFHNSIDRCRETPQELKQAQDLSWQKERIFQEEVAKMEKTQERIIVSQEQQQQQVMKKQQQQQQQLQQQQQMQQLERQKKYEAFQMPEKRPIIDRLPALQQPCSEPRYQNASERSPRLPEPPNRMWASQIMFRPTEPMVSTTTSYQQHPAQPEMDGNRVGYSVCAGHFAGNRNMYAAPKLGVTGSKRNFDAITGSDARIVNDGRIGLSGPSSVSGGSMNSGTGPSSEAEAKSLCQPQMKPPSGMQMYPWSTKATLQAPAWQHIGLEQSGGSFGPFPSSKTATPVAPLSKNTSEAGPSAGADAKTWDGQPKSHQEIAVSSSHKVSAPADTKQSSSEATTGITSEASAASTPRAPTTAPAAVGWPPLRSVRKSLAVTPRSIPSETPAPRQAPAPVPVSTSSVASQSTNSWFVKVNMDGYPVGRKVDLKNNSSYDKLSQALDDMFRPQFETFLNGQNNQNRISLPSDQKRNFLQGPDFVLTYEDQDGDLMLVGDVPWTMFIDTVKRLRIMKGSEAIGLGNRGAEKSMKTAQANV